MVEWFERQKNIFSRDLNGVTEWLDSPSDLGTERVRELAEQYGFEFVLTDDESPLALPVAYRNEAYVVYRVKN